jgi:hypothetical protein
VITHTHQVLEKYGANKIDLSLKYRSGLEIALAKADTLNNTNMNAIQALITFLLLSRGSESPRYVWLLTGLVIRMAQSLGLHRDGSHFKQLAPYEVQMRRRVWWLVLTLDLTASEDQGIDLFIANDSFDTNIPLNLNDEDLNTETHTMPEEREGLTDMSITRLYFGSAQVMRKLMATMRTSSVTNLQEQSRMLDDLYRTYEKGFLQYKNTEDMVYRFSINAAQITMAKMKLIVFLPVLFSSPSEQFTNDTRDKLLVSAIEVAEYNHALHIEQAYNPWRWICQTYTHWHAIVFMLIEIRRRPWSCIVERAWVALQSPWLIPTRSIAGKNPRTWIPLQSLIAKVREHREAELNRLRSDVRIAAELEVEDQKLPLPSSTGLLPTIHGVDGNRSRWRQLVSLPEEDAEDTNRPTYQDQSSSGIVPGPSTSSAADANASSLHTESARSAADISLGFGSIPWLWADAGPSVDVPADFDVGSVDIDMDLDRDVNWHQWIESAMSPPADERTDEDDLA